jgi:hypothetical protein
MLNVEMYKMEYSTKSKLISKEQKFVRGTMWALKTERPGANPTKL